MNKHSEKKAIFFLIFLMIFVGFLLAETLMVKVQTTYIRKEPKFYASTIKMLKAGDAMEKVSEEEGWFKVLLPDGTEGWIHSSAVEKKSFSLLAINKTLKKDASADEVALASKGFNKQVEQTYRERNKEADFSGVDRMEKIKIDLEQIKKFLQEGKLGEYGGPR